MAGEKILVIEDEAEMSLLLKHHLQKEGFVVSVAADGLAGWQKARQKPDLVILDLMLPEIDGLEVCRRLRREPATADLPVIMLTARGEESDIVAGLEVGADDYLAKPFRIRELLARVRSVLRRASARAGGREVIEAGKLLLDRAAHRCLAGGREIVLTAFEFRLLWYLAENRGRVMSRRAILRDASPDRVTTERTVDVHVRHLREKMGPAGSLLETVRGVGYRINA